MEKLAYQGLVVRQRALEREQQDLQSDHNELLAEIESRLDLDAGALTDQPPTHAVDAGAWNVVEVEWAKPTEPSSSAEPSQNGKSKIRTHAGADRLAADLGLTFEEGMTVKEKVTAIETRQIEAAASAET